MDKNNPLKKKPDAIPSVLPGIIPQIQVTLNCNQDCTYCFQQHRGPIISLNTVEKILRRAVRFNADKHPFTADNTLEVYWHGGEPLLAGLDFFQQIVKLQSRFHKMRFENRIQTNGTLMTADFAQFLTEHRFDVGFSLDGPEHLHNLQRKYKNKGIETFKDTMKGIEQYRHFADIDKIPAICVITKNSIKMADEIFSFFKDIKAHVQLDIYDIRIADLISSMRHDADIFKLAPSPDQIQNFLITLFDLWFYDPSGNVDFKEFRNEVKMILQPELNMGDPLHKKRCDIRRTIFDPDGNIYACDQYLNDRKTALGNIHRHALDQVVSAKIDLWETIKKHIRKSTQNMACSTCRWGNQCSGGCISCMKYNAGLLAARKMGLSDEHWFEAPLPEKLAIISGEFYFCDALRAFRNHVEQAVNRQLEAPCFTENAPMLRKKSE